MSYDPFDSSYRRDPLDGTGLGLDGLGGYGNNDGLALQRYDSGLDDLGGAGLDSYGSAALDGGLGGLGTLSLDTDLDGYNTGLRGGGLDGLGGYDSGYGALGSGLSGDFSIPQVDGDYLDTGFLNDPTYASLGSSGLGLDSLGSGLGSSGLGDLGDYSLGLGGGGLSAGLDGLDGYGSLGDGLDDYGALGTSLGSMGSGVGDSLDGLGGLGGIGSGINGLGLDGMGGSGLNGLRSGLDGLGSAYMSNYNLGFNDIGSGLDSLGWSSYDGGLGLDSLGSTLGSHGYLGDAALLGGAALAGGALGAAASPYGSGYDHHNHLERGLSGDIGGLGELGGYSSNPYGISNYDTGLGILGSSAFSFGAYDGYGSGLGISSPTLRYSDLANYENRLYTDQAISAAERQSLLADRMAWEALDDAARMSQWNSWDDTYRNRLGVADGYWGSRYGSTGYSNGYSNYGATSLYDPMYAAYGWSKPSYSNYGGYDYSYGYGAPTFYNNYSLSSVPYGLTSPVQNYYGSYLSSWDPSSLPYWSDDSRWREAADLAYYQQRLAADRALSESERMMRWQQRLEWEALDQEARKLRWASMAEDQRERLGLGLIGSYAGSRYGSRGYGMSLPYELPSQLRSIYSPYLSGQGSNNVGYMDSNYARYNDLVTWAQALRHDRKLAEAERLQRWRMRMEWEMLDEAEKRNRWRSMPYRERAMLGLAGGFWDSGYGLSDLYNPQALRPMRFPVSSTLARMFSPYKSKAYLARALREGQEDAIAFADLVAFENALRADKRLRAEDKLRRWKARIRWQEMNERDRRLRYFQMQEAERRMLGLGLSSFFGRRYAAPLFLNGIRGLPPPRASMPLLRAPLPDNLRTVYAPVMARQLPLLSASNLARANTNVDPAKNLADRIRLSLAQKAEALPGISSAQRLAATEQKRRILREMDNERQRNQDMAMTDEQRMRRFRAVGF